VLHSKFGEGIVLYFEGAASRAGYRSSSTTSAPSGWWRRVWRWYLPYVLL